MAKVKSSIATSLQGRIGNVSFRRAAGQRIIAAELPALVTNPRTAAQMSQRVRLAALVNFYRVSRYWMPKAFELKDAKQSNYNAFIKANLAANPVAFTKQEAAQGASVVYPWRVANGTLPPVSWTVVGQVHVSNIFLGIDPAGFGPNVTVGAFSTALLNNNLSLREGDQLSVIVYNQGVYEGVPYLTCNNYEVTIDTSATELLSTRLPLDIVIKGGSESAPALSVDMSGVIGGFAVLVSRNDGGNLRVSKADLRVASSSLYSYYTSQAHQDMAAASYGEPTEVFLDPNGLEVRGYQDMSLTRQILGVYIGEDAESAVYYPAGAVTPSDTDGILSLLVSDTQNLASADAVVLYRRNEQGQLTPAWNFALSDLTVTETTITTSPRSFGFQIARIWLNYADGEHVTANFAQ